MKKGDEIIKCCICGREMKKSQARSYGDTDPDGRYTLHWICPLMESPDCYVKLLFQLSTRMPRIALENGR